MLSTPIFEQLCRELVDSGGPEEASVAAAEAGQGIPEPRTDMGTGSDTKPVAAADPDPEPGPGYEPRAGAEPVSEAEATSEADSGSDPEAVVEPEPEPESAARASFVAVWTPPEERVA